MPIDGLTRIVKDDKLDGSLKAIKAATETECGCLVASYWRDRIYRVGGRLAAGIKATLCHTEIIIPLRRLLPFDRLALASRRLKLPIYIHCRLIFLLLLPELLLVDGKNDL